MSARKITRITIESESKWMLRLQGSLPRNWCARCGAEVETLTVEQAVIVAGCLSPKLLFSPEIEGLHTTKGDGSESICLPSLLKLAEVAVYQ